MAFGESTEFTYGTGAPMEAANGWQFTEHRDTSLQIARRALEFGERPSRRRGRGVDVSNSQEDLLSGMDVEQVEVTLPVYTEMGGGFFLDEDGDPVQRHDAFDAFRAGKVVLERYGETDAS